MEQNKTLKEILIEKMNEEKIKIEQAEQIQSQQIDEYINKNIPIYAEKFCNFLLKNIVKSFCKTPDAKYQRFCERIYPQHLGYLPPHLSRKQKSSIANAILDGATEILIKKLKEEKFDFTHNIIYSKQTSYVGEKYFVEIWVKNPTIDT